MESTYSSTIYASKTCHKRPWPVCQSRLGIDHSLCILASFKPESITPLSTKIHLAVAYIGRRAYSVCMLSIWCYSYAHWTRSPGKVLTVRVNTTQRVIILVAVVVKFSCPQHLIVGSLMMGFTVSDRRGWRGSTGIIPTIDSEQLSRCSTEVPLSRL